MAEITLGGNPVHTSGELPEVGSDAPTFSLVGADLGEFDASAFAGKNLILNIFPSVDTGVCSASVRKFNELAAGLDNATVFCISNDLPFAMSRFCGAEGIENVTVASGFRSSFGDDYGLTLTDTGMRGLLARAVVVLDEAGKVTYTELVPNIGQEPDYDAAVAALS